VTSHFFRHAGNRLVIESTVTMKGMFFRPAGFVAAILFLAVGLPLHAQPAGANPFKLSQTTLTTKLSPEIKPLVILTAMQRVADWQLAHPATNHPTGWVQAAGDAGMMALAGIAGDPKYRDAMTAVGEANGWELPAYQGRKYHADDQCIGQVYAELYFLHRENKMIAPMRDRFDFILSHPSDAPGLDSSLPQGKSEELWSWCDALFMAPPAWLRLYAATDDRRYLDFAVTNWRRTTDYLYDKDEHLFFRDRTYFKKPEANGKKIFWSCGNGWVFAAIVRVLQYLPANHPDRPRFEQLFKDMAGKILLCQPPDGLWRASLLDPQGYPTPEASGSALFTYGFAWGVNQGLLDRAKFEPAVRNAWAALVDCVDADGKITHIQPAGTEPVKFAADSTAPYGVGAFLLAGSEVYRLAALAATHTTGVIPLIEFEQVPLSQAISVLARQAGINYILDPNLGYDQPAERTLTKPEPVVTIRWTEVTAAQALQTVLSNYDLQMVQNPDTKVFRVSKQNPPTASARSARGSQPLAATVKVANPAPFRRDCETVELDLKAVASAMQLDPVTGKFAVMDGVSSRILDSQVYASAPGQAPDKLLFQVDLAPGETRTFYLLDAWALAAVPPPIVKTFARYVPERMDDFAWESDRIAHRTYGQALIKGEGTISSGPDVWIKRRHNLIIDRMYKTKRYHEDNGDELDDYRVGKSRGCGGVGIWDGQKLYVSSNYRNWRLITTGPIRSEFELTYDAWDVGSGRKVSETKCYRIDAGSWFTQAQSTFASQDPAKAGPLTIAVGLAERACGPDGEELIAQDQAEGWMSYWQPEDKPKGTIGVAIILPKGSVQAFTNDNPSLPDSALHAVVPQPTHEGAPPIRNLLAVARAEIGKPFGYYFGACWDRSGDFTNHVQWENYVRRFAERRDAPLQVTIGN
jgi:rhamnogalacturonyl hydrolase YesR